MLHIITTVLYHTKDMEILHMKVAIILHTAQFPSINWY